MDLFPYDRDLRHERVKYLLRNMPYGATTTFLEEWEIN